MNEDPTQTHEPTPASAPSADAPHSRLRAFLQSARGKVILILVALFALGALLTAQVYERPVTDDFVRKASNIIPFPALKINGEMITIKEYLIEYDALVTSFEASSPEGASLPEGEQLEDAIVDTIINKTLIQQLAGTYGVEVTQEQVDGYYQDIIATQESEEVFVGQLLDTFGWTTEVFKERIVRSIVLALEMTEYVSENEAFQAERLALIESAKARLDAGEDFGTVAKETHEQIDQALESDLGYVNNAVIPESWSASIEEAEIGGYTDIQSLPEGYAIFKVLDRVSAAEDSQVHLQAITVPKVTLEEVVEQREEESSIKVYL